MNIRKHKRSKIKMTRAQFVAFRKKKRGGNGWARSIHRRARHLKVGTIIETCGLDVARVIAVDPDSDDLNYVSLTRGHTGSCSIYNCGPVPLRPVAIARRLALFKEGGMEALSRRYYVEDCHMTPDAVEAQIAEDLRWKA